MLLLLRYKRTKRFIYRKWVEKLRRFYYLQKACRDRQCTDLPTATGDSDFENLLSGCQYNGGGCVPKSAIQLHIREHQKFAQDLRESMKPNIVGNLVKQLLEMRRQKMLGQTGTTDAESQKFLPLISPATAQLCITDGTDIGKQCSFFKETDETCQKFTATDDPCKESAISAFHVACTPKVCYQAPNTFTDKQCSDYYPTCKTTGGG